MSAPVIGFVSTRHGIGKTTLVYNLGWMYARLGWRVLLADLDPQADLTADAGPIDDGFWPQLRTPAPLWDALQLRALEDGPWLLASDPRLAAEEDGLARAWLEAAAGSAEGRRQTTALGERVRSEALGVDAHVVLVDLSSSLGALNRAALVGCDHLILTIARDYASFKLLPALRETLDRWRREWLATMEPAAASPAVTMRFPTAGYVVLGRGHARLLSGDTLRMYRQAEQLPPEKAWDAVMHDGPANCLGVVKDYPALIELAREAGKPLFALKAADGAMGAHAQLVVEAYRNFREIAEAIARRCGLPPRPAA